MRIQMERKQQRKAPEVSYNFKVTSVGADACTISFGRRDMGRPASRTMSFGSRRMRMRSAVSARWLRAPRSGRRSAVQEPLSDEGPSLAGVPDDVLFHLATCASGRRRASDALARISCVSQGLRRAAVRVASLRLAAHGSSLALLGLHGCPELEALAIIEALRVDAAVASPPCNVVYDAASLSPLCGRGWEREELRTLAQLGAVAAVLRRHRTLSIEARGLAAQRFHHKLSALGVEPRRIVAVPHRMSWRRRPNASTYGWLASGADGSRANFVFVTKGGEEGEAEAAAGGSSGVAPPITQKHAVLQKSGVDASATDEDGSTGGGDAGSDDRSPALRIVRALRCASCAVRSLISLGGVGHE